MKNKRYLYLIQCNNSNFYKIGSSENPEKRLRALQVGCPYPLVFVYKERYKKAIEVEKFLHKKYRNKRKKGEWFEFSTIEKYDVLNEIKSVWQGQIIDNSLPNYIPMLNKIRAVDSLPPIKL